MSRKFRLAFGATCALFFGLCLSREACGQALPDGKGKAEFVQSCTACHRTEMTTRLRKTPDEWKKTVDDMVARGADGSKEDLDNIVLYLDTNFAADKSDTAAATQSTTPSSTSGGPVALNSLEIERVKRLITENGCLTCHRIEKQGAYTGPTLNGVGEQRTGDEIRAAIVRPNPTLDPSNNLIRLTTTDGKTIVGRILSQDDHGVRVIDSSGEVATYSKSGLGPLTIVDSKTMPSYEGKIIGQDLEDLIHYLASLPSVDESPQK
jgi:putative heme-binding domain-containing protein